jgi:hypothetical protein
METVLPAAIIRNRLEKIIEVVHPHYLEHGRDIFRSMR